MNSKSSSFDFVPQRSRSYQPRPIVYSSNRISDFTHTPRQTKNSPKPVTNSIPQINKQIVNDSQPIKSSFQPPKKEKTRNKNNLINGLIVGMAVLVFIFGIGVSIHSLKVNKNISEKVSAQSNQVDGQDISEDQPTDEDKRNYSVAPEHPRMIYIPSINVSSRVKQVGINKDGELDVPNNVFDTAWYKSSALPGSPGGATLIDGHVSGPTQKGAFYNLKNVKQGDIITIEKGDLSKVNYKVKKVEIVETSKVDMANILIPVTPGSHGLNLISCTGKYDEQKKDFEQRVLVFAEIN